MKLLQRSSSRLFYGPFRNLSRCLDASFRELSSHSVNSPAALTYKSETTGWSDEKFRLVPFMKEDLRAVMEEVPDVKYYYIGDSNPIEYPYKDIPMDEPIPMDYPKDIKLNSSIEELKFSRLENNLKIISLDNGGYLTNLGLFIDVGSRWESENEFGCSRYIEHMAFQATAHLSWLRTIKTLETLGVDAGCTVGREHMVYHAAVERKFVPVVLPLLTGNVVFPRFLSWDTDRRSKEFNEEIDKFKLNIDMQITEALHTTAWFNNTLGNSSTPLEKHLINYKSKNLRDFMLKHFSPDRMLLVGLNYPHNDLCKWVMRAFVDYETIPHQPRTKVKAQYTGGECRVEFGGNNSHIAIGFETPGGWNSEDLIPLTVLQTLLGGGGAFSTGGPGKGMYTRLYLEATCWVESCVAFNTQYTDSGIFGLYITASHNKALAMIRILGDQFNRMGDVTESELSRAKNSLKASIWMNLESRGILLEDLGRQFLMSGKILSGQDLCNLVDKVTSLDIKRAVTRMLQTPMTVVSYGDLPKIPRYDEIKNIFKGLL